MTNVHFQNYDNSPTSF